jgi:hypothetical protein
MTKKAAIKFPYVFEKNGRIGRIYKAADGTFPTYFLFAGKPDRNSFTQFDRAKSYLSNEFDKLDIQSTDSASLYALSRDRKYYHDLEQLLHSKTDGATLRDAVDFYLTARPKTKFKPLTVAECSDKFILDKTKDNLSAFQIKSLRNHLKRFGEAFGKKRMHEVTSEEIKNWLHSQKDRKSKLAWSIKYKINVLGSLVTFAKHSKDTFKAFPNSWGPTEFELVRKPKRDLRGEVEIYSPHELDKQLDAAISHDIDLIPIIVLGAFLGLRPSEAHGEETKRPRLSWEAFDWHTKHLNLRFQKVRSKATRSIPIHPTAELWLRPFSKLKGAIWKARASHDERLSKICERAGIVKIQNGYRHSYASYRIIHLNHDYSVLAAEMGNSEREVINSYRRSILPKEADKWFQVRPPRDYEKALEAFLSKIAV